MKGADELSTKDVLSMDDLTPKDIELIFRITLPFKEFLKRPDKKIPLLKGKSTIQFFFETSTRTRVSFELAGKHLGADTINVGKADSSIGEKGETLNDTALTLDAMRADCIILRHSRAGTPQMIAKEIQAPVINGGDGWHEHPTQTLLDLYTIYEKKGRLKGIEAVIVGDILHSRVAGSLMRGLKKMGVRVRVCGPATLMPCGVEKVFGVKVYHNLDEAIQGVDVAYALRIQAERGATGEIPTVREYSKQYVINERRLKLAKPDAIVMHAGPVIREVDITTQVLEGPQSVVQEQVTNGFAVRLALLSLLVMGKPGGDGKQKTLAEVK
ncbi:MAG: aspartate carbamoyltransferase catalytic subunit [Candidatus Aenigmarchaeota archaeon]|nr:aspartate carbamoyltransferase catalytic subunit [Candidatus Aenigmarchaeota archaeon]